MRLLFTLLICLTMSVPAVAQDRDNRDATQSVLAAIRSGAWTDAREAAATASPVVAEILLWHRLRGGLGTLSEVEAFTRSNADWPDLQRILRRAEDKVPAERAVDHFTRHPPQTAIGILAYADALRATDPEVADAKLIEAWTTLRMPLETERLFLRNHRALLAPHHPARIDMLLWKGQRSEARHLMLFVDEGQLALAQARIALQVRAGDVDAKLKAVPKDLLKTGGLVRDRFEWRVRKGLQDTALELLLEQSTSAEALGDPQGWSNRRRSIARDLMRDDKNKLAYRVASNHFLTSGSSYADLEWLSGFLALRKLDDPAKALAHFEAFEAAVKTPISKGRAFYWLGRTHEALGDDASAQNAYQSGARYQTSFYGLLAAERGGYPLDPALTGPVADWENAPFTQRSVFQAAALFISIGEDALAERFLTHLADILPAEELPALGAFAVDENRPHIAVMIGKRTARRGIVIPQAYFPVHPMARMDLPVDTDMALAIARRESEFDPVVISGAGARGLMQLMPRTAQAVARDQGLPYRAPRLLSDWHYNAQLGSAYLSELFAEFGNSPVMVAAGYNAGPGRPKAWIKRFGDPRLGEVDIIDWIEHIPFRETRNYVMRVTESLPVYRARLTGEVGPLRFTEELVGALPKVRPEARPRTLGQKEASLAVSPATE